MIGGFFVYFAASCPLAVRTYYAVHSEPGKVFFWLGIAVALICLITVTLALVNRIAKKRKVESHAVLFRDLCKLHGLDAPSRRLLKRVVRFYRLKEPGRLFTEPKWLNPANLGVSFQSKSARLEALRCHIFYVEIRTAKSAS